MCLECVWECPIQLLANISSVHSNSPRSLPFSKVFFLEVVNRKAKILVLPGRLLHQIGQSCHYNNLLDKLLSYSFLQDNCIIKNINHVINGHHTTIQKMVSHSQDQQRPLYGVGWGYHCS